MKVLRVVGDELVDIQTGIFGNNLKFHVVHLKSTCGHVPIDNLKPQRLNWQLPKFRVSAASLIV